MRTPKLFSSKISLFCGLFTLLVLQAFSQKSVPGSVLQNIEKTNDSTTLFFYSSVGAPDSEFEVLDLTSRISFNSTYPRGYNDGPVWKGKGLTLEVHGGVAGKKGKFSYQFMPVVFFSQNSPFELAPRNSSVESQFAYQFTDQVDWVQRYGSSSSLFFHPGQSEIKFQTGKFVTSLSTQNYSVGPSFFNPILLSQQGGGFPHLRIGSTPFSIGKIGIFEVNALGGVLIESDHFDNDSENDSRIFNGLFINYSPGFLKNLKVGFGKVLYKQTRYFEFEDAFALITILEDEGREGLSRTSNDSFDQLASFSLEWSFPEVGFRAYTEFAKNDFTGSFRGTLIEPEHTRGYTIGFEKVVKTKKQKEIKILYEHTNLSHNQAWLWRATPSFYTHNLNTQGYSNAGQLLGAGIGPGGNADNLMIDIKNTNGTRLNFHFQRIEHNRDYFTRNETIRSINNHDVEYSLGTAFLKELERLDFFGEMMLSHNFQRYYSGDRTNLFIAFGFRLDL